MVNRTWQRWRSLPRRVGWALIGLVAVGWVVLAGQPLLAAEQRGLLALELDDRPEPFVPLRAPTTADRDHLEALALFSAARSAEQRGELPAALRLYQRAWRYDSQSVNIARQIVDVAQQLNRVSQALRYATRAVELDPTDARLASTLADQLVAQGEFADALKLYEHTRALLRDRHSIAYLSATLQVGRLAFLTDQKERAAQAFDEVLIALEQAGDRKLTDGQRAAIEGEAAQNYELFAQAMLAVGRPDRAAQAFARAERRKPSVAIRALHQAQVLAVKKEFAAALAQLETYFGADDSPADSGPLELLAELLEDLGRSDDLLPRLERLVEQRPTVAVYRSFLARQYLDRKQYDRALALFEQLHKKTMTVEGMRGLMAIYIAQEKAEALVRVLGQALEKTKSLDAFRAELSPLAQHPGLVEKLAAAARAVPAGQRGPSSYHCWLAAGLALVQADAHAQAEELFERALETPAKAKETWNAWVVSLLRAEQYPAMARVARRAVAAQVLPRDNPTFHSLLALALEMSGDTEAALGAAREAAEVGGHTARLESRVAWVFFHARRYPEALRAYQEFVNRFADDYKTDETRSAVREARLTLSNLCMLLNQPLAAEEWLEQVLDEYPDDISALNDLGYLWADRGANLDRALQMTRQAVAAEPDNGSYRDSLGWVLYRLGRHAEAIVELERAVASDEPDGTLFDHLGDAYQAVGRRAEAEQAWKRGLESLKKQASKEPAADAIRDERIQKMTAKLAGSKP